jgi:septal ring factor EnvC (AmiA/AmiB activator)
MSQATTERGVQTVSPFHQAVATALGQLGQEDELFGDDQPGARLKGLLSLISACNIPADHDSILMAARGAVQHNLNGDARVLVFFEQVVIHLDGQKKLAEVLTAKKLEEEAAAQQQREEGQAAARLKDEELEQLRGQLNERNDTITELRDKLEVSAAKTLELTTQIETVSGELKQVLDEVADKKRNQRRLQAKKRRRAKKTTGRRR